MNQTVLQQALAHLQLGGLRYFDSVGSTNDEALAWAEAGARDMSLVVADEQTGGRGRLNRKWLTPADSAIAASLILRPEDSLRPYLSRVVGLAALALLRAFEEWNLNPQIKWPNDILLNGKKVAGILIENIWTGDRAEALVLGMGINVRRAAVPPAELLQFPAASMEEELGEKTPARAEVLRAVLENFTGLRKQIETDEFLQAWEAALAFRGWAVKILAEGTPPVTGELVGLAPDGSLRLKDANGKVIAVRFGDVSLRTAA